MVLPPYRPSSQSGVTLVEMMVTMVVATILMALVCDLFCLPLLLRVWARLGHVHLPLISRRVASPTTAPSSPSRKAWRRLSAKCRPR